LRNINKFFLHNTIPVLLARNPGYISL